MRNFNLNGQTLKLNVTVGADVPRPLILGGMCSICRQTLTAAANSSDERFQFGWTTNPINFICCARHLPAATEPVPAVVAQAEVIAARASGRRTPANPYRPGSHEYYEYEEDHPQYSAAEIAEFTREHEAHESKRREERAAAIASHDFVDAGQIYRNCSRCGLTEAALSTGRPVRLCGEA